MGPVRATERGAPRLAAACATGSAQDRRRLRGEAQGTTGPRSAATYPSRGLPLHEVVLLGDGCPAHRVEGRPNGVLRAGGIGDGLVEPGALALTQDLVDRRD